MANPICVDLSHHNPTPNWPALKSGGTLAVIMKATEGQTYTDNTFSERRVAATQAGLKVFSYHYFRHGNVSAQMAHYLDVVKPVAGERVVIDYEENDCTIPELRDAVAYLLRQPLNLQVTVYGGSVLEEQLGSTRDAYLAENTSLWTAQYTSAPAPSWPTATWPAWSLWQYTDRATVSGISAPVDGNRFNGSDANFLKWVGPAEGSQPVPEPGEQTVTVDIKVNAPPGVHVDITVNGEMV